MVHLVVKNVSDTTARIFWYIFVLSFLPLCLTIFSNEENIDWKNSIDEITLATVLDITPDLLPCDLAILCHKPCREVCARFGRNDIFNV